MVRSHRPHCVEYIPDHVPRAVIVQSRSSRRAVACPTAAGDMAVPPPIPVPMRQAIRRRDGNWCESDLRQRPAITRCRRSRSQRGTRSPLGSACGLGRHRCGRPGAALMVRRCRLGGFRRDDVGPGTFVGPGTLWALEPCGADDADREACGGCAPRGIPRSWRPRLRGRLPGVKLADPEGNRMMLAARQCWLDAAECGELGAAK
jgi:hypothetical protein